MIKNKKNDFGLLLAFTLLFLGIASIFFPYDFLDGKILFGLHIDTEEYDKLGDFISGVSAPLLTVSAFILLYKTYKSQKEELEAQKEELKENREILKQQNETLQKQQFETTFFNMLTLHNQIVENIMLLDSPDSFKLIAQPKSKKLSDEVKGRESFRILFDILTKKYVHDMFAEGDELNKITLVYKEFIQEYISQTQHYFRNLYQIIIFIENSTISNKSDYANIIKSQMTDKQLIILFYDGVCDFGFHYIKYLEKYSFFDRLTREQLLKLDHYDFYSPIAYGKN